MPRYRLQRWARGTKSQPLQRANEAGSVGERQPWRETGKFFRRRTLAEQDRDAMAILGAFHVNCRIADKPNRRTGGYAALRQGQMDRRAGWLVGWRGPGAAYAARKNGAATPRA